MRMRTVFPAALSGLIWSVAAIAASEPSFVGKPQGHLAFGEAAPEIAGTTLSGDAVTVASLRAANPDKIMVLQFGSITDPIFRAHVSATEFLAGRNTDKALFVVIYQKEAHAADGDAALEVNKADGFNPAAPMSLDERTKLARQAADRLAIKNETVLVDVWSNTSARNYGSYPNMTFVIDSKGNLAAGYPFMDVSKVRLVITALATGQQIPAELRGTTLRMTSSPAPFDYETAAMDMTGGRGPATVAAILDRVQLAPNQRQMLLPTIADFLADVQAFREARQNLPADQRRGPGRGRGAPPSPQAASAADAPKVTTPEDVEFALGRLHDAAQRVQTAARETMNDKDARQLIDALASMAPAQSLFTISN